MTDDRQNLVCLKAYIDRIENGFAVIVLDNEDGVQFEITVDCLPPDAKAGEHLFIYIQLDKQGKEASHQRIAKLLDELGHGTDSDATGFKI